MYIQLSTFNMFLYGMFPKAICSHKYLCFTIVDNLLIFQADNQSVWF